jgi:hypothetical protein
MSKKYSLLLVPAFCFALVALVGSGTNVSACHDSGWSKPVDNICYFGGWHHTCDFGGWQHMGCSDHQNNNPNCGGAGTQTPPTTTTPTPPSDTTTSSDQSTTTPTPSEQDDGYSVVVGAVGAGVVPIAVSIAVAGCVVGSLVVFIKKRP